MRTWSVDSPSSRRISSDSARAARRLWTRNKIPFSPARTRSTYRSRRKVVFPDPAGPTTREAPALLLFPSTQQTFRISTWSILTGCCDRNPRYGKSCDDFQDLLAVALHLERPNTGDRAQVGASVWVRALDLGQGRVVEDHIRGEAGVFGGLGAPSSQRLEERSAGARR